MILQPAAWLLDWKQILFSVKDLPFYLIFYSKGLKPSWNFTYSDIFWHSFTSILEFWCFDPDFLLAGILGCIETTRD